MHRGLPRRRLLIGSLAAAGAAIVAACTRRGNDGAVATATATAAAPPTGSPTGTLEPTPSCVPQGEFTPAQTEGPFYKPTSPEKSDLLADVEGGTKLVLSGWVLSTDCTPVERAVLDFWQADADGNYDNAGFRLRGHQFSAADGRYQLTSVVPGVYTGRTRHLHVKVQPPTGPVLTTQLYFPGEPANQTDGIYRPELEMTVATNGDASFTFVMES